MSEDKSADAGTPGTPFSQSLGEAPPTTPIPKQTLGEAAAADAAPAASSAWATDAPSSSAPSSSAPSSSSTAATEPVAAAPATDGSPAPAPTTPPPSTPAEPVQVIAVPPPVKRRRGVLGGAIFAVIVLVLLGAIGFLVYQRLTGDPTKNAAAGQCLAGLPEVGPGQDQEAKGGKLVDCGDSTAVYRIESRLDNQDANQAKSASVCKASPEATVIYRAVPDTGTGYVLCLKKL